MAPFLPAPKPWSLPGPAEFVSSFIHGKPRLMMRGGSGDALASNTDAGTGSSGTGFTIRRGGKSGLEEPGARRSEEHTSELQSHSDLVCRLLLEKKNTNQNQRP